MSCPCGQGLKCCQTKETYAEWKLLNVFVLRYKDIKHIRVIAYILFFFFVTNICFWLINQYLSFIDCKEFAVAHNKLLEKASMKASALLARDHYNKKVTDIQRIYSKYASAVLSYLSVKPKTEPKGLIRHASVSVAY